MNTLATLYLNSDIFRRLQIASITDERVQVSREVVAGMRIVKMYSWEKPFQEVINNLRRQVTKFYYLELLRTLRFIDFY